MLPDPLEQPAPGGDAGLEACPQTARIQLRRVVGALERELAGNLVGVYLHGSLAMGCFNPRTSDLDLLVLTDHRLEASAGPPLIEHLLSASGSPHPIEISLLGREAVEPWQYPTPFDLHFSESWRGRYERAIDRGDRIPPVDAPTTDTDLAAHIAVTRERGVTLFGESAGFALPAVPAADLRDSLLTDLRWARERMDEEEGRLYGVLNACRTGAYLHDGRICSKLEGGRWALAELEGRHHAVIRTAIAVYRQNGRSEERVDRAPAEALIDEVIGSVGDREQGKRSPSDRPRREA